MYRLFWKTNFRKDLFDVRSACPIPFDSILVSIEPSMGLVFPVPLEIQRFNSFKIFSNILSSM